MVTDDVSSEFQFFYVMCFDKKRKLINNPTVW